LPRGAGFTTIEPVGLACANLQLPAAGLLGRHRCFARL